MLLIVCRWWEEIFSFGKKSTAGWASLLETLTLVYRPGHVLLGRFRAFGRGWFQPIGMKVERHLAMIAGTGSGKTVMLVLLLALHRGSSFVIDPKGQITKVLYRRFGPGGGGIFGKKFKRALLDPFNIVKGIPTSSWNAFVDMARFEEMHGPETVVRFAAKLAEGLIKREIADTKPFFVNSAKAFIRALIIFVYVNYDLSRRSLVLMRDLLTQGMTEGCPPDKDPFDWLLFQMSECTAYGGIVAGASRAIAQGSKGGSGDVLATAREQTVWLDLPEIRAISERSDFYLDELKTSNLNLSVVANATDVKDQLSGYFRTMTVAMLYVFENLPGRMKVPCFTVLDEFPSLGNIAAIETSAALMRSYGVRLLPVAQDVSQLAKVYPGTWTSFLGGADFVWYMSTNHQPTLNHIEEMLGKITREVKVGRKLFSWRSGRSQRTETSLLTADQIKRFLDKDRGNIICARNGKRPLRLKMVPYFQELPVCFYDRDRDFREAPLRALTRLCFRSVFWVGQLFKPRPRINQSRAEQMFCLSRPYSRAEVKTRYAMLQPAASRSTEYAAAVKRAQTLLMRKATA